MLQDSAVVDMGSVTAMTAISDAPRKIIAFCIVISILGCIVAILRKRGKWVCSVACSYVVVLAAIALVMRELMTSFNFPAFVTVLHYLSTWVAVVIYHVVVGKPELCLPSSLGTPWQYVTKVLPFAIFGPISIALNNKSLVFIGAGLSSIVGSLSPISTACATSVFGRRYSLTAWTGVLVAFAGCALIAFVEVKSLWTNRIAATAATQTGASATVVGLIFAFAAVILRSLRTVLQELLTSPQKFDNDSERQPLTQAPSGITGMQLLAVQSPAAVLVSITFTFATESVTEALHQFTGGVVMVTLATCAIATILNILAATLLKELGSAFMQIVGKLNSVVTVAVSMGFFGEHLSSAVLYSYAVVIAGVAIFEAGERQPALASKASPAPPHEAGRP